MPPKVTKKPEDMENSSQLPFTNAVGNTEGKMPEIYELIQMRSQQLKLFRLHAYSSNCAELNSVNASPE